MDYDDDDIYYDDSEEFEEDYADRYAAEGYDEQFDDEYYDRYGDGYDEACDDGYTEDYADDYDAYNHRNEPDSHNNSHWLYIGAALGAAASARNSKGAQNNVSAKHKASANAQRKNQQQKQQQQNSNRSKQNAAAKRRVKKIHNRWNQLRNNSANTTEDKIANGCAAILGFLFIIGFLYFIL